MNRCEQAYNYHKEGYNCAQAVVAAFSDLTGLTVEQSMAVSGGFGGGVGGSHAELCGAISGGVIALSLLCPHVDGGDKAAKVQLYQLTKEFRARFEETFGMTVCGDLLRAHPGLNDKTTAAAELGITAHCDIMIVTAVQIVEQMLAERG